MTKRRLADLTTQWGKDRGITINGKITTQTLKFGEEMAELFEAKNEAERFDAIGDMAVVITLIAKLNKTDVIGCMRNTNIVNAPPIKPINPDIAPLGQLASMYGVLCSKIVRQEPIAAVIGSLMLQLEYLSLNVYDTTLEHCWGLAYNEIKDRKGKLLENGNFVKE